MKTEIVYIILKDSKATIRVASGKVLSWTIKSKADLEELIELIKDRYGKDTMISINYIDKGKNVTINSNYVRKIIYPLFKQYKRIKYNPDRLIEVSVSNKDIKQDRLERLQRDMVRAKKCGNKGLMSKLFRQYLKFDK